MKIGHNLSLLFCLIYSASSVAVRDRYFNSKKALTYVGYWGNWGSWEYCDGGYAVSFSQKVEGKQGGDDDTALNGICLKCNNGREICSRVGGWGSWASSAQCSAGFTGADFKVEGKQGGGDDTAANALELVCASGGSRFVSNNGVWGSWEGYKYCSTGQRICGIQTRVEPAQGGDDDEDDTALNGVDLRCCGKISSVHVQLVEIYRATYFIFYLLSRLPLRKIERRSGLTDGQSPKADKIQNNYHNHSVTSLNSFLSPYFSDQR